MKSSSRHFAFGSDWSFGDVGSMSGLLESGHGGVIDDEIDALAGTATPAALGAGGRYWRRRGCAPYLAIALAAAVAVDVVRAGGGHGT
jgi:hypothetical protein